MTKFSSLEPATVRFHGLDLVRLVSFFAIATFHVSLIHYYTPTIEIASQSAVIGWVHAAARVLSFSGFTVCFLTSVLTAFSGRSKLKRARLFAFLCVGWLIFSFLMSGSEDHWLVWDIYPLIFVGVLTASLADLAGRRATRILAGIGFAMLWVPWWTLGPSLGLDPTWLGGAVVGVTDCAREIAEWPMLPWVGLVWCGYGAGRELRELRMLESPEGASSAAAGALTLSGREAVVWVVLLAAGTPWLGAFYKIDLGRFFSCEAYQQPPFVWWAHFAWPLMLMRLSVDPRVAAWLARTKTCRIVSSLAISRHFWLAYILNYLLCYLNSWMLIESGVEATRWNVLTIEVIAVGFLPLTEIVTRAVIALARLIVDLLRTPEGARSRHAFPDSPEGSV